MNLRPRIIKPPFRSFRRWVKTFINPTLISLRLKNIKVLEYLKKSKINLLSLAKNIKE